MGSLFNKKRNEASRPPKPISKAKPPPTQTIQCAILCASEYEITLDYQAVAPWYQGSFRLGNASVKVEPPIARNSAVIEALVLYVRKNKAVKLWRRGAIFGGSFSQSVPHLELTIKIEYDPSEHTLKFEEVVDSHAWQGDR